MTLQTISASRIKTYKTCARQYQYKYALHKDDRPEQDKNIGALLGTSLHKAIESRYSNDSNAIQVFQDTMKTTYEEWEAAGYTIRGEEWYTRSLKDGRAILNGFDWDYWQPIALELNFTLPFPNEHTPIVLINGIIDMVDKREYVVDWKSQRKMPAQDQLDNDPQFIIYAWAYRQINGRLPKKLYWKQLRTDKLTEIDVLTGFDEKLQQLSLDIEAMLGNTHYQRRMLDSVCKTECSFYDLCFGVKK